MPIREIGARVLVVDDNPCGRETVVALLEQAGYDLRTAVAGFQAERLLNEFVPAYSSLLGQGMPTAQ